MTKEILLSKGYVALVDDEDYDFLSQWKWTAAVRKHTVYAYRMEKKTTAILMHRVLLERVEGRILLSKEEVDHVDRCGLNNTRRNIRLASHADNNKNRGITKSNSSGYKGVGWDKYTSKWVAYIRLDGKHKNLGRFSSLKEAAMAYDDASIRFHGDFSVTNKSLGRL